MSQLIRRPDLEAQAVSLPDYVVNKVLPFLGKPQIAGTLYYQPYNAEQGAQYNRNTADGSDITMHYLSAATDTFSCVEVRGRYAMGYTQTKGYADQEHADLAMGRVAKRDYFNKIEALCASAILTGEGTAAYGEGVDLVSVISAEVTKLRDKTLGKVGLVMSNHNFVALKANSAIREHIMKFTGVGTEGNARYIGPEIIAEIFGADEVIIGRDDLWYTGAYKNNIVAVVIPDSGMEPAEAVQLGRTVYFEFDGADDKLVMESFHHDEKDLDVVDAKGLIAIKVFNSALLKRIALAEAPASSY